MYILFLFDIIKLQLFIPRLFYGSVLDICIRLPTTLFILVNIMISKIYNSHIIYCHNIVSNYKILNKYI